MQKHGPFELSVFGPYNETLQKDNIFGDCQEEEKTG